MPNPGEEVLPYQKDRGGRQTFKGSTLPFGLSKGVQPRIHSGSFCSTFKGIELKNTTGELEFVVSELVLAPLRDNVKKNFKP